MRAAATPSRSAADTAGCCRGRRRERLLDRATDELMHRAAVAKAHFGLGRMHVDVDQPRIDAEPQRIGRLAVVVQHVAIRFAQRVREHAIAHEAPVDEQILAHRVPTSRTPAAPPSR